MFRIHSQDQLSNYIDIKSKKTKVEAEYYLGDVNRITNFFNKQCTGKYKQFKEIINDDDVSSNAKSLFVGLVSSMLKLNINYSSINRELNKSHYDNLLSKNFIPRKLTRVSKKYIKDVLENSSSSAVSRGTNALNMSKAQISLVEKKLNKIGVPFTISFGGATDFDWLKGETRCDGIINEGTDNEIVVYCRYGTTTGGSQSERWKSMQQLALKYPDQRFLFIVDGIEVLKNFIPMEKWLQLNAIDSAMWSTVGLLDHIDYNEFTMSQEKIH